MLGQGKGCRICKEKALVALGERRTQHRWPEDYIALLLERLSEADRRALFIRVAQARHADRPARPPMPSKLLPTISPGIDERLIRDGLDTDARCLRALATLPRHEQGPFYDRYRKDRAQALRWAQLPAWKRPIMAGDAEDRHIWKLFTILRLKTEWCARFNEKGLAEEGYKLTQLAGMLGSVTDPRRLAMVLSIYGSFLRDGVDVGDVMHPPWPADNPRKDR